MNDDLWTRRLVVVALPLIVIAFYLAASGHFRYTPDDTFIYLRFARNMIHGDGISFNAGEPTYGITGPLWLLIVAAGGSSGADLALVAKGVDLVAASGAVVVFYLLAFAVIRDVVVALLATLALSVNIWLVRWAGSGMETSLAVLLVVAAAYFCFRNEYLLATITAALLVLVRPEGVLFALLLGTDIVLNSRDRRRGAMLAGKLAVVYAAILAPWLLYAYGTFGTVIPNTALAKSHGMPGLEAFVAAVMNIGAIIGASDGLAIAAILVAGFVLRRQLRTSDADDRFYWGRAAFIGLGWAASVPALYLAQNVTVLSRYMLLVTPFLVVLAFAFLTEAIGRSRFRRFTYAAVFVFTGLVVLQGQVLYRAVVRPGIEAFAEGMDTSLVSIGRWLHEHTRPDETVLCWDIGAIGYYSDRRICDAAGLVTPGLIPYVAGGFDMKEIVGRKLYAPYCTVDFVVHRDEEPDALAADSALTPLFARPFYRLGLLKMRQDYYTVYHMSGGGVRLKETP